MRVFACLFRGLLLGLLLLPAVESRATTLIATNTAWRFFRGTTSPSPADPAGWRQRTFADTAWETGNATFHYGEPGFTGTELTDMQNTYTAVFLRKRFTVANPANVVALDLTTVCDDGFVAYLNGTRVASLRAPDTDPDQTSLATAAEEYVWTTQPIANPATLLVPGENVLAVIVLNGTSSSSDLVFDAELVSTEKAPAPPYIATVQPAPGLVTNLTSVTVTFSENVTGVEAAHFLVNGVPATIASGAGTTYTFTFAKPAFGGVQISWGTLHHITDLDVPPQRFDGGAAGSVWSYELLDPTGPAVVQRLPPAGLTVKGLPEVAVTFSRAVTGVDAGDLRLNGVPANAVTGTGVGPYRFLFANALAAGPATVTWSAGHGITSDEPEPHSFAGAGWSYTVDPAKPAPQVVISEFMAENAGSSADEDGDSEDWIELHNRGASAVNLEGWSLTNDREETDLWTFPAVTVPANGFLVVWASGKDRRTPAAGRRLHTHFKLNPTGDTLRLLGPELPRVALSEVEYPAQGPDFSYGRQADGATDVWRHFAPATPGFANGTSTITGRVDDVHFSVRRGYYDKPFTLSLACPTPGAMIRYTTNGSAPSMTNGAVYAAPIVINASRVLRAAAFATNQLPSDVGTHTYLFNLAANRRLLPALSLVTGTNNLYGRTGIMEYSPRNTDKHGPQWERPVSVELLNPSGESGFHIDAGLRVAGGDYIRSLYNYRSGALPESKYSFRLYFRGEYGPGRLNYPMFPDTTVDSFNSLHLRAGMNDHSNPLMKDEFVRSLVHDVGLVSCHGTFVNLFLNGVYKGIYNPAERVDDDFLQAYHGGGKLWDVIGAMNQVTRGDSLAWDQLRTASRRDLTVRANYLDVAARMDLANFVDYLLPHIWADNDDWPHNNTRAAREHVPGAKFRFYPWDAEFAFTGHGVSYDTIANTLSTLSPPWGTTDYQQMFNALKRSPEFKLLFADRVHRAFFNDGPLTDPRIRTRYETVKARVAPSISGFDNVVSTWINGRRRYVTNIFLKAGFLASTNAPVLSQHGGIVPAGFRLTVTNLKGTIHFTTDGVDPRVPFEGTVAPTAQAYTGPLTISASTRLLARSLDGTNWSALADATFTVADQGPSVRFSEIMFNPQGGDAYEFLELLNTGGLPVNLADFSLTGVTFRFPNPFPALAPGARLVLANTANRTAFSGRYPGVTVGGWFTGSLSNGGERLALLDRAGRTVVSVTYGDSAAWPAKTDGDGLSLEINDANGDPDDPANWHASAQGGGTPGAANSTAPVANVRLNEIFARNPAGADWIELHNPGAAAVNLAGWSLTDDGNDPRKFVFPAATTLPAHGYLLVQCDTNTSAGGLHCGFLVDPDGENVILFNAGTNRADLVTTGPVVPGHSLGRNSTAAWTLCEPTPTGPNEPAVLGSPAALRLNEYLANAEGGDDWLELHNPSVQPVAVTGCFLATSNAVFRVTAPVYVAAGGFVALKADENPGPNHVDFKLTAAADMIALTDPNGAELDRVTWRNAGPLVPTGRLPDGSGGWTALPFSASPGASNYLAAPGSGLRFDELMARNGSAVTNSAGRVDDWIELHNPTTASINLTGYSLSVGKVEAGEWIFPAGTTLAADARLIIWAATNATTTGVISLGRALRDAGTTVSLFDDRARLLDSVTFGLQLLDSAVGRTGSGWQLLAFPTPGRTNSAAAPLGNPAEVRLNEWLADGGTNSVDWFELYNPGTLPVNLAGHFLTDDPSIVGTTNFAIPPLTLIAAGGYVQFLADGDLNDGPNHVGFQLDALGETLRLSDLNRTLIDSVSFLTQATEVSEGRFTDGTSLILKFPGTATPGAANQLPDTDRDGDGLPDAWEIVNGFNPDDPADGTLDPDGDGVSTADEFAAGTDPRNAASVLRLTIEMAANATVTVRFPAVDGRSYSVLYSDAPAGSPWLKLADVAATEPVGGVATVPDATPAAARPVRYYKVVTPAAP